VLGPFSLSYSILGTCVAIFLQGSGGCSAVSGRHFGAAGEIFRFVVRFRDQARDYALCFKLRGEQP
jgi:hypothetical protein